MKTVKLAPIRTPQRELEELERVVRALFRRFIYQPLVQELKREGEEVKLTNSIEDLVRAIQKGRIQFNRGLFTGKFSAATSLELKKLGAKWDRKSSGFRISRGALPPEIVGAVEASEASFLRVLGKIDDKLAQIFPPNLAERLDAKSIFDRTINVVDRDFRESVKSITIAPELTDDQKTRIADEWTNNLQLSIRDWADKEIRELRAEVQKSVLSGNRFESLRRSIQKSYGVSANKAKFLARQETNLLVTKLKETRYQSVGVNEYEWRTVAGSPLHPVRPAHKKLEGKIFRWDDPPITSEPGQPVRRNNPGQDFNCRCFARPVVRFGQ